MGLKSLGRQVSDLEKDFAEMTQLAGDVIATIDVNYQSGILLVNSDNAQASNARMKELIAGWKAQGWALGSTRMLFETLQPMARKTAMFQHEINGMGIVQAELLVRQPE